MEEIKIFNYMRRCKKCGKIFYAATKHGKVCKDCNQSRRLVLASRGLEK